jgi:hypothetical protein
MGLPLREGNMEPYILFVHLSVLTPKKPAKELTWTAEFTSQQSCEAAAKALEAKYPSDKGRFVLDYMCLKK